jgi:hypothetical protein
MSEIRVFNPLSPRKPESGRLTIETVNSNETMQNEGWGSLERT